MSKIAAEIGRHRSSIYREIKRNGFEDEELPELNGYYGIVAQHEASKRRPRRKCLGWRTPTEASREEMMKLR